MPIREPIFWWFKKNKKKDPKENLQKSTVFSFSRYNNFSLPFALLEFQINICFFMLGFAFWSIYIYRDTVFIPSASILLPHKAISMNRWKIFLLKFFLLRGTKNFWEEKIEKCLKIYKFFFVLVSVLEFYINNR